jgi:hypothetical protein
MTAAFHIHSKSLFKIIYYTQKGYEVEKASPCTVT